MSDLSLATLSDTNASSSTVSIGEQSLMEALSVVRTTAHHDEAYLTLECVGVVLGIFLFRHARVAV